MNNATRFLSVTALCCAMPLVAVAQPPSTPPPASSAQSEAGEPRADTSSPAPTDPGQSSLKPAADAPAPGATRPRRAAKAPAADGAAGGALTTSGASGPGTPAAVGTPAGRTPAAGTTAAQKGPAKVDRLELGTATVTGDREQPKVMYIVPWKRSDIGDLAGKPMNSLVDEILAPVDRDVFKREVVYYRAVQADASQNGAPPKPAQQGEK